MHTSLRNAWRTLLICITLLPGIRTSAQITFSLSSSTGNFSITCADTILALSCSSSYTAGAIYYNWGLPGAGGYSNTALCATPGIYTVTALTYTQSAVQTFTVWDGRIQPIILFVEPPVLDCLTHTITTPVTSVPSATFSWAYTSSVPVSVSASGFNVSANYTLAPTNTLVSSFTLTATDTTNGCANTAVIPVYQNIYPPRISISGLNRPITCATPSVMLINTSTSRIPPGSMFANTSFITATWYEVPNPTIALTPSLVAHAPGSYTMVVQDNNNGCRSDTVVTVGDGRVYPVIGALDHYVLDCPNGTVSLGVQVGEGPATYSYLWAGPPYAFVSSDTTAQVTATTQGYYTVIVTNNSSGCCSSTVIPVWACVGLEAQSDPVTGFRIFPNPASHILNMEWPNGEQVELEIRNTLGQLVYAGSDKRQKENIDIRFWATGVYYANVKSREGQKTFKFIKE